MPILVPCSCGKKLQIKDELSGKRIRCPACQAVVAVPKRVATKPISSALDRDEEEVPTLELVNELDAAVEAADRDTVRFWTSPKAVDTLVVLTEECLYVADMP